MVLSGTRSQPATSRSLRSVFALACAVLATLSIFAVPARTQLSCPPAGPPASSAINTSPQGGCHDFVSCFVTDGNTGCYGIALTPNNGQGLQGDLNSTYFNVFYSIANALALSSSGQFELVLVGSFPNARYFSITNNDMHYTNAEHLTDFTIDPAGMTGSSYQNPFVTSKTFPANPQWFAVPVSLGAIPAYNPSSYCAIDPFEEDNLIDATQRHPSIDWNTVVSTSGTETAPPPSSMAHVVDMTSHMPPTSPGGNGQNMAGDLVVRSYLAPPNGTPPVAPYVIIRDVATGCAYYNSTYYPANASLVNTSTSTLNCKGSSPPSACAAIVSVIDPSCTPIDAADPACGKWLDMSQQALHSDQTQATPQACYANGDARLASPPPFGNMAAWVRSPEWVGRLRMNTEASTCKNMQFIRWMHSLGKHLRVTLLESCLTRVAYRPPQCNTWRGR